MHATWEVGASFAGNTTARDGGVVAYARDGVTVSWRKDSFTDTSAGDLGGVTVYVLGGTNAM